MLVGLACYVVLAVIAFFTLEGQFRNAVWILLAGLSLRTYIGSLKPPE